MKVYIEAGSKKVFVCALDYPGWARAARTEEDALEAFVRYGPRYQAATKGAATLKLPRSASALDAVERVPGDATTDFGAPSKQITSDKDPLTNRELKNQIAILRKSWDAFDAAAKRHRRATLRKGPRGGGRDLDKIVEHVLGAEIGYFNRLGGRFKAEASEAVPKQMARVRDEVIALLDERASGHEPPMGRRTAPLWSLRYFIRRSAWHALDHAWEIEDKRL